MSLSLYGLIYKFAGEEKDFANKITELGQKKGWFVDEIDWSLDLDR